MIIDEEEHLAHYGILRRSGRYPWGSGNNEVEVATGFLKYVADLKKEGLTEAQIAKGIGVSTTALRAAKSIAKSQKKMSDIIFAQSLKDKGYANTAIGKRMGLNESSVRSLLAPGAKDKAENLLAISNMLERAVEKNKYIDVGSGVEYYVGVSKEKLGNAVAILREKGYEVLHINIPQLGRNQDTRAKILAPPGTTQKELFLNRDDIKQIREFSDDGGRNFFDPTSYEPLPVSPDRVGVLYNGEGGEKADGVIYVRPGVDDLTLGGKPYAQVRIQVGDGHYLKGMAVYKDDLPEGTDLLFNTAKYKTDNKLDALKELERTPEGKVDPDLPFGALVTPIVEGIGTEKQRVVSAMNIVNEEGDWHSWSRTLASQMLSKQPRKLAKEQLAMTYESKSQEFKDIMELTNPTVKRLLLEKFADSADSAAVHLKAAKLPGQATQVIMPVNSLKENEIYAPANWRDGDRVVLIRYPHAGTFEIPELVVNNKNQEAKKLLGNARDAVGIHHKVAERMSGADFDGDFVIVIPNNSGKLVSTSPLAGLKDFDPIREYPAYEGMPRIKPKRMQQEMGSVSNLITDMTIKGAPHSEIVRAVRHSMVIIDSEKKHLNWKESEKRNGIRALKEEYQGKARGGASTLVSRASREVRVKDRKPRPQSQGGPVDKETGRRVFVETGKTSVGKGGVVKPKLVKSKELAETDDAFELSSGTPIEKIYAEHSNKLKSLANKARLASINTPPLKRNPSAAKAYAKEVASLNSKLDLSKQNAPLERQAQVIANANVRKRKRANPNLTVETKKKIESQELEKARARMGASKKQRRIEMTQSEWDAIQAGAISNHKLSQILRNTDLETVKEFARPKRKLLMTPAKTKRAQSMLNSGYTRADVAKHLGVSLTTLDTGLE